MDIKSFRAKSMQEALELVRRELGPEAALLHTREVPRRGLLGLLGRTEYELAAARDANLKSRFEPEPAANEAFASQNIATPFESPSADHSAVESPAAEEPVPPKHAAPIEAPTETPLVADAGLDLEAIAISNRGSWEIRPGYSGGLARIHERLINAEVPAALAEQLCDNLQTGLPAVDRDDDEMLAEWLRDELTRSIVLGRGLDDPKAFPRIVAAIGPTGVGKTTTIAKLAARARFEHRRRVGLVTVDTYRIAAVDQLQTYAEIMDLPMKIVATPTEVRGAIAELADCEQIFIDTAGRSPRDEVQVQQLRSLLKAASPDETYLVLSATSSSKSLAETVEKFAPVGPTSWVLTKIDEVGSLGNTLSFLRDERLPLAYVTNGQEVPHAIASAEAEDLVGRIL